MSFEQTMAAHSLELRRGTVVLATLASLDQPRYGYALLEHLSAAGIDVEGNTLYPLLRRLEKQGLLTSEWDTGGSRPRKFYSLTPLGRRVLEELRREWGALDTALQTLSGGSR